MGTALGGCASSLLAQSPRYDAAELTSNPTMLVATTRKPVNGAREKPWFGSDRAKMTVARARMTPPSDSRFSLAAVGLSDWQLDGIEPASRIGDLFGPPGEARDVLIYVHGYNTSFEAAVPTPRACPTASARGETLAFSWPSPSSPNTAATARARCATRWSRCSRADGGRPRMHPSSRLDRHHAGDESSGRFTPGKGRGGDRIGAVVFACDIDLDGFIVGGAHRAREDRRRYGDE